MKKESGTIDLALAIIIGAVVLAAFLGLWAYYGTQLSALKADVKEKDRVIKEMTTKAAEDKADIVSLKKANELFEIQVTNQNLALEQVKKERDEANKKYQEEKAKAAKESAKHKQKAEEISGVTLKMDERWFDVWGKMSVEYVLKRQGK